MVIQLPGHDGSSNNPISASTIVPSAAL